MLCSTSFLSRWAGYGKSSLWPFRQVDGPSARSFSAYPEAKIPSNFKVVRNENDRGRFVVLLGWLHARPPQLEKYSKLWQDKGFSFIQVVPPDTNLFTGTNAKALSISKQVCDILSTWNRETQNGERPEIFFHLFSNGGLFPYIHILQLIEKEFPELKPRIVGSVYDSCPAAFVTKRIAHAFSIWTNIWILQKISYFAVIFTISLLRIPMFIPFVSKFYEPGPLKAMRAFENLELHNQIATLWLYSRDDMISDPNHIELLIRKQVEAKQRVQSFCFPEKSKHIMHLMHHPELYTKKLGEFIEATSKK